MVEGEEKLTVELRMEEGNKKRFSPKGFFEGKASILDDEKLRTRGMECVWLPWLC